MEREAMIFFRLLFLSESFYDRSLSGKASLGRSLYLRCIGMLGSDWKEGEGWIYSFPELE